MADDIIPFCHRIYFMVDCRIRKKEKGAGLMIMAMVEFVQQKKSPGKIAMELSAGKIFVRWNGKERSAHMIHQIMIYLESIK